MKQKGININLLSITLFLLTTVILTIFGFEIREANHRIQEQMQIEENRRMCEEQSHNLADASDYLTSEVWHFVATNNVEHMENYWSEVNHIRKRDLAIERLTALSLTDAEQALIQAAKEASDELVNGEAWAMRLVADSIGMSLSQMPPEVAAVKYANGEARLSREEKQKLASQYIFGEDYTAVKKIIKGKIASFQQVLRERKTEEVNNAVARTRVALRTGQSLLILLILVFFIEMFLYYLLLIRPLYLYSRDLERIEERDFTQLAPMGGRETVAFANAFNQIYSGWRGEKERLEQEQNRFHIALDNTSVIVYEYDIVQDIYTAFGSLEENDPSEDCCQRERRIPGFLKEHAQLYLGKEGVDCLNNLLAGTDNTPVELQVRSAEWKSQEIWVRITGTLIYGADQAPLKLIGKVTNIQSEKEKEFALEDARNRDRLTGLYKKEAGIRKIRSYMEKKPADQICGLMLLDMDAFYQLNETEGQAFANAVLQEVADILIEKTGPEDILVRLGGDEFMMFIKGCPKSRATQLGPEIAKMIEELSLPQNSDVKISASIGMCVTEVVDEYSGLYRCAESTLKYVKEHGKGKAACYLDTSNELGMLLTQMYPGRHQINKIDRSGSAKEDLGSFALDLLGKSKNLDDAIALLLARVGKVCGFDRICILETDMEYFSGKIICQWAKRPADWLPAQTRYPNQQELYALSLSYDADGLCDHYTIPGSTNMESVLHAAIWNYGIYAGAMIFEVDAPHHWTDEERSLLSELTKIISSFTLKARADAVSQAKTDFLSRMSHEIRTPMNAITGMTAIAKTVLDDPARAMDCLDKIESANKYLLNLINDVLDMSRIESGKVDIHFERTRLGELVRDVETLIRPQAIDKGIEFLVINSCKKDVPVMADSLRLNQVLVNLLGNAVKFTGTGGKITFRVEPIQEGDKELDVRFSVKDTGIGISEEAQGRIFNAFEQAGSDTASNYGGTGLGLAISSRLVQLMGGTLQVQSEPGKGSDFHFTLRLACAPKGLEDSPDTDTTLGQAEPAAKLDLKGKRLLLAEDNSLNQEIAQEILSMHGFIVETASNGKEALDLFAEHPPKHYDAILMDIRMPVMDGFEATRRIRTLGKQDSRSIPIIAMTANAFDEDMKKSLENGMDGHLSKPIDVEKLMQTLQNLISCNQKQPEFAQD